MGGGGGGGNTRELDQTPTWAVASVCGVIVLISILLEKGLHKVGEVRHVALQCTSMSVLLCLFYSHACMNGVRLRRAVLRSQEEEGHGRSP
jgi:hypothetical protein